MVGLAFTRSTLARISAMPLDAVECEVRALPRSTLTLEQATVREVGCYVLWEAGRDVRGLCPNASKPK